MLFLRIMDTFFCCSRRAHLIWLRFAIWLRALWKHCRKS
jgi:hypothetical protein